MPYLFSGPISRLRTYINIVSQAGVRPKNWPGIVSILTFPQQVGGCGYPTIYTRPTGVLRACVFNFRRNEWNRRLCHREIEKRNGMYEEKRGGKKREKDGEKREGKKAGKLAQSLSARRIRPRNSFPGHRLFVYIGSSISIYNMPSPHATTAAVATAGRKSHRAEKWFFLGNVAWPATHTIVPIRDSMISRN